ncbi:hypothetical protein [Komagataeibacter diospyri]|uniref:hypothetical protein n=1 Tax=Komagataeibacter diospyri TaxID=1932662 RepID=UPI0011388781|nr:hypothetical protein [Komagataeibacter diospyri]GCE89700.1 hypothetical protein MSKU15_1301 [Komagataeibacter diospyri]
MADTAQNYILYRTTALTAQPASYTDQSGTTVTPAVVTLLPAGEVIATQMLTGLDGVTAPAGLAFALDADGKYPVGSIYTPPAATTA